MDSSSATQPFTVMAKPVGALCNASCSYCYYLNTPLKTGLNSSAYQSNEPSLDTNRLDQMKMSETMLEQYIYSYIKASPGPIISFVWHGGEPTIAGLDFFRLVVELQKRYLPHDWTCWNNLQTNGILLDEKWCEFIATSQFDVGLSIDGTPALHDHFRTDHNGNGTYNKAKEAVRRLQSFGVQPDLLCTVTSKTTKSPVEVYRALRSLGTEWIQFIPIVRHDKDGVTQDSVTPEGYGTFLCDVFDEWVLNDIGKTNIQFFAETARVWSGGSAGLCWMAPTCGRVPVIEHDGSIYSCDHFVDINHRIGNITEERLDVIMDSAAQLHFGQSKQTSLPGVCRSCEWLEVCNGGCPKDRFMQSDDGEPGLNYLCKGLSRFFSYAKPAVSLVTAMNSRGFTPDKIMSHLRNQLIAVWKNVGRNDPCPCGSGNKAKLCCWHKKPS